MADPRLNSVHLPPPRREDYRRAREVLLNARGWETLAAEGPPGQRERASDPPTLLQDPDQKLPSNLHFWLQDHEFVYPLKVGLNTVGRSPDNDVVIEDGFVSRRHCAILVHAADFCELHDTASKNGTYLNGRRLAGPTRLAPGDEIRMCDRQLHFQSKAGPSEPSDQTMNATE